MYGIVREALTNVARHAPGAFTTVTCRYGDARTESSSRAPRRRPVAGVRRRPRLGRGQGFLFRGRGPGKRAAP
ncbi:hypothetical protein GCM10023238_17130 [Streptomyces heliomycini]